MYILTNLLHGVGNMGLGNTFLQIFVGSLDGGYRLTRNAFDFVKDCVSSSLLFFILQAVEFVNIYIVML